MPLPTYSERTDGICVWIIDCATFYPLDNPIIPFLSTPISTGTIGELCNNLLFCHMVQDSYKSLVSAHNRDSEEESFYTMTYLLTAMAIV